MTLWIFVLARIVSNPVSNVFQKLLTRSGAAPLFIIFATFGFLGLACFPFIPWLTQSLERRFWTDITLCAFLAVAGNATLVAALKRSDLSILGPINSYKAAVSLIPGIVFLHEIPTLWQLAGIILIVGGSLVVVGQGQGIRSVNPGRLIRQRGVQLRFAALVFSAVEAIFLKRALIASSPFTTFAYWALIGFCWAIPAVYCSNGRVRIRSEWERLKVNRWNYLLLALTTGIMQLSTLETLRFFAVGPALALFQTSTILTVVLGRTVFIEKHFLRRILGSLVMILGAIIIIIFR